VLIAWPRAWPASRRIEAANRSDALPSINGSVTLSINVEIYRGMGKFPPPVHARRISRD
jgi:hypothetical protein